MKKIIFLIAFVILGVCYLIYDVETELEIKYHIEDPVNNCKTINYFIDNLRTTQMVQTICFLVALALGIIALYGKRPPKKDTGVIDQ